MQEQDSISNNQDANNNPNPDEKFRLWKEIKGVLSSFIQIRDNVNYEATMVSVNRDVEFKGYNIWILIASIFIASIGLNANSAAVIIGAMLISPLMGPIVGIGMAMATNNFGLLLRAVKNTAVFVLVSIIASAIYFKLTPLGDAASELIGRTKPTFLDVLVAFFGGVAGIVANSRTEKTNVIPGVAIATALMPPLCTAGYGLANNMDFFWGASYLFLINTVFIATATFLVARYLQFPRRQYVDPKRERKYRIYFLVFLLLFLVPSINTLVDTYRESRFKTNVQKFVNQEVKTLYRFPMVESSLDSARIIISTSQYIDEERKEELRAKLNNYNLGKFELELMSQVDYNKLTEEKNEELSEATKELDRQFTRIQVLEGKLNELKSDTIPFYEIQKKAITLFPNLKQLAITNELYQTDFDKVDFGSAVIVEWKNYSKYDEERLVRWLNLELETDSIRVVRFTNGIK